jgi:hypothetical protein
MVTRKSTSEKDARRILEMVGVLHSRGYESLFLSPGMAPSGAYWRYHIGIMKDGKWSNNPDYFGSDYEVVSGSLGSYCEISWEKSAKTLSEFTDNFIEAFKVKLQKARVPNPAYVSWFKEMLEKTAPDGHFLFYCDPGPYFEYAFTWGNPKDFKMPMPQGFVYGNR